LTGCKAEAELGRRMSLVAQLENERSRIRWGASPTLDRRVYNQKKMPLSLKASRINRMLLKKLNIEDIADFTQTSKEVVGHIVSKYNLPRSEV